MHFKPFMLSFSDKKANSIHFKLVMSASANPEMAGAAFSTKNKFNLVSKYQYTYREFKKLNCGDEIEFNLLDETGKDCQNVSFHVGGVEDISIPVHNGNSIEKRFLFLTVKIQDKRGRTQYVPANVGDTLEVLPPIPCSTSFNIPIPGCWLTWPVDYEIPAQFAHLDKRKHVNT